MKGTTFNITALLAERLNRLREQIIANIDTAGEKASGATQQSLRVDITDMTGTLYGRAYFATVETGRRPGKMPPVQTIKDWIAAKGLHVDPVEYKRQPSDRWQPKYTAEERGINRMAWSIAYKIGREGSRLYRDGGRTDIYTRPMEETIEEIRLELAGLYRSAVEADIRRWSKELFKNDK